MVELVLSPGTAPRVAAALRETEFSDRLKFARVFASSRRQAFRLTKTGAKKAEGLLRDFRGEILSRLSAFTGSPNDPFLVRMTPQIAGQIGTVIGEMTAGIQEEWAEVFRDAFDLGSTVTARALQAAGVPVVFPTVSPELLTSAVASTGRLLTETGRTLGRNIMRSVRIGAIGLQPASQTIREVGSLLQASTEAAEGRRRRIGFNYQAETIARTELGRIYSNAQQAASERTADLVPDLKKSWVTSLAERRGHRAVEEKYQQGGSIGPIPVKSRFDVSDFSRSDFNADGFWTTTGRRGQRVFRGRPWARRGSTVTDKMLFPRDPAGSAGNVINCTCFVDDVVPGFEDIQKKARGEIRVERPVTVKKPEPTPKLKPKDPPLARPKPLKGAALRKQFVKDTERFETQIGSLTARETALHKGLAQRKEEFFRANPELPDLAWWKSDVWNSAQAEIAGLNAEILSLRRSRNAGIENLLRKPTTSKIDPFFVGISKKRQSKIRKIMKRVEVTLAEDVLPTFAKEVGIRRLRRRRSFYRLRQRSMWMADGSQERSFFHEFGHHLEHHNPAIGARAKAFLARRTKGETAERLRDITAQRYARSEIAKKDRFIDPYMGRIYDHDSTEITSMGLEYLFTQPARFAREDPEYFDFMVDTLAGAF